MSHQPFPDGIYCTEERCPAFDGKRCELLGHQPSNICEPYAKALHEATRPSKLLGKTEHAKPKNMGRLDEVLVETWDALADCALPPDAARSQRNLLQAVRKLTGIVETLVEAVKRLSYGISN